ncbi:MAG: ABC transporter permease [Pseudodonghicola sp.]
MGKYLLTRLLYVLPSLLGVLIICFFLTRLSGDPTHLFMPVDATDEALAAFRAKHGLDRSLPEQFWLFVYNALHGDFGTSLRFSTPAIDLVAERLPATLELALATLLIAVCTGIPLGVAAAYWRGRPIDTAIRYLAALGQSVPTFYWGIVSIIVLALWMRLLPTGGREGLTSPVLPATTLATTMMALIIRVTRSSMLNVIEQDYIRTARAKGQTEFMVVVRHALGNSIIPVITVIALQFGVLLGGVVVTETVFSWPGVGRLAIQAIYARDYPVVQAVVLFFAVVFVFVNLLADLLYSIVDPRVRLK